MVATSMQRANDDPGAALRAIPSLDAFLRRGGWDGIPRPAVVRVVRRFLDELRTAAQVGHVAAEQVERLFGSGEAAARVTELCEQELARVHVRVRNATGIVLHTGLGRAPLAAAARDAIVDAAGYAVVEVDRGSGERNQRESATGALLAELTGAPAALVVNNNAAAVALVLAALARAREVVVSRGELVEIGGGFRMPDVMAQAGCRMVEVGATNRTHRADYERAIGPDTAMLLKVHPSNFRMLGFAGTPPLEELVPLAHARGLIAFEDLGSGLLVGKAPPGLEQEPLVRASVQTGADLVCFSGDKLLGGPQCGIVVGRADLVRAVRAHPLYRAFRCDKLTLAALEATLRIYRDGDPLAEIPALRMITAPADELESAARRLAGRLRVLDAEVVPSESFAGSGANPARPLPSFAVALRGDERLAARLRAGPGVPLFTRVAGGRVLLDLRTLLLEDLDLVADETIRRSGSAT
jgi:L-seryl-tRNA(Ser) seleniumtransferase